VASVNFAPLFLVSLTAVGMETALTRYFAVASWSDYGYWVISIVMMGFAFSGVTLALAGDVLRRRAAGLFAGLPAALVASGAVGYEGCIVNPFNPLQLQNQVTYLPQLANIGLFYAALLPFFCLAGLFISLCFVTGAAQVGRVYAADLAGAGAGCVAVLGLMYWLPPFGLIPALLPALALAGWLTPRHRVRAGVAATVALVAGEALLALGPQAAVSQYKPIYAPLHTPGVRVLARVVAPEGDYLLLDDFTERVNTDISNDAAMLGYPDPPRSYGLYRDGTRIASIPYGAPAAGYAAGALDALPYRLLARPDVLLVGASGGFRIAEVLALGARRVEALEPEPVLYRALRRGIGPSPAFPADPRVTIARSSPVVAAGQGQTYDLIDISADFMDAGPANVNGFTVQALAADLRDLRPGGILSVPVSIEEFPAYALRMLATARAALAMDGIVAPDAHVLVYRSAWNARILISPAGFGPAQVAAAAKWCDDRSFDVSYYQGIDPAALRDDLYNELPAVSFDAGTVTADGPDDSIADEAGAVLGGRASVSGIAFDLRPATDDRPAFYAILRLGDVRLLLARLQILPQAEIGALVNLAVLGQAVVIAALVLCVPLAAPRLRAGGRVGWRRPAVYFSALALGFLFIEIFAIEKASALLDDRATGFAVVLSAMLLFSGLGSFASGRFAAAPERGVWLAGLVVMGWAAVLLVALPAGLLAAGGLPEAARVALVVAVIAPVSLAMGLPFPLGLGRLEASGFLPWAWGLNGAFSVVATPLANLIARNYGFHAILAGAALIYGLAVMSFPRLGVEAAWLISRRPSPAGE
jgi:hypothetical protein